MRAILAPLAFLGLLVLPSTLGGCASQKEIIHVTSEGRRAGESEIDRDAFRLLPPGAVVWVRADAPALFGADFGEEVSRFLVEALPFAKGAGIEPERDIELVVGAMYATVGSDVVFVCKGQFDKAATSAKIAETPKSVKGKPIVSVEYSGSQMYVVEQVAMSVLTDQTMVFGTQLGVRRVLERVEEGRLKREVPPWYEALLSDSASQVQLGIDLDSQPIPATLGEKVAFMKGLRAARILGNFRAPGLNLAGTLTYQTPQTAAAAAEMLSGVKEHLEGYDLVLRTLGISQPVRKMKAQATGKDVQMVAAIEGDAVAKLLENGTLWAAGTEASDWLPN